MSACTSRSMPKRHWLSIYAMYMYVCNICKLKKCCILSKCFLSNNCAAADVSVSVSESRWWHMHETCTALYLRGLDGSVVLCVCVCVVYCVLCVMCFG